MIYYVLADPHFGHAKMVTDGHRPEGFEKRILENLSALKDEDVLLLLGDVAFYDHVEWFRKLREACKAKIWLIKGNHDRKSDTWYLNHGCDMVCESMTIKKFGVYIDLTHEPIDYDFLQRITGRFNVHGHLHTTENSHRSFEPFFQGRNFLVSCEESNYTPQQLRKVVGK